MSDSVDHHTFHAPGGVLAYRDTGGSGRPVVLLHAAFVDSSLFGPQLAHLRREHRVIAPDARGHGASAVATGPYRRADDVAALLRYLGVESAVLVGVSMGAMTAVETALEYPDLVAGLVVGGRGIGEPEYRDSWSRELLARQDAALAGGNLPAWLDGFVEWAVGPRRAPTEVDPAVLDHLRRAAARTLAKYAEPRPDPVVPVADVARRARRISVPVLAVDGAADAPELTATVDTLLRAVPYGRRVTIEDAGHFPNLEQPAIYNALVTEFLAALDPARAAR
ncbi:alpha/beta fold hydrolase [Nocardia sp. SSK8]|uniref:alpha/beta fold hydrolase n=1 Tax=Nocardia sp. SSK8 TaxID=3120154 RepID=UPI003009AF00